MAYASVTPLVGISTSPFYFSNMVVSVTEVLLLIVPRVLLFAWRRLSAPPRTRPSRPVVLLVRGKGPSARMFLVFVPSLCGFDRVCFVRCENCLLGISTSPFYSSNILFLWPPSLAGFAYLEG